MNIANRQIINDDYTDKIDGFKNNSFNTVKLIAAFNVLYGHTITHLSIDMPRSITTLISFFQGVPIFFAISGFLIWKSVQSSHTCFTFYKKRFLRIYPELWVGVLIELIAILLFFDVRNVNIFIQLNLEAHIRYGFYAFIITLALACISTLTIGKISARFKKKLNE